LKPQAPEKNFRLQSALNAVYFRETEFNSWEIFALTKFSRYFNELHRKEGAKLKTGNVFCGLPQKYFDVKAMNCK
jgi:hypothetical protein